MPTFSGLPRAVLQAISNLSGEEYRDVNGSELIVELRRMGHDPSPPAFRNVMFALRDNGGYVDWYRSGGGDGYSEFDLIRLAEAGRQEVESWPRPGTVSAADVEALLALLEARADDPDVPEVERSKARGALTALRDLGTATAATVLGAWLERQAGLG